MASSLPPPEKTVNHEDTSMWVEKYRPNNLDELIAHEQIISTIKQLLSANKLPHLLLYGPPGTGKTSTILAIAKQMFGPNYHNFVMELNASDDRGIDVIRQQIKEFASTKKIFSQGFKLIILDEADHMTKDAQAALRRVIEKYTKNVRFCLVCNYVNNIIPALQSRCTRFRFAPLKKPEIASRLREIAKKEGIQLENSGLDAIYKLSNGDMRKCLMMLQSTYMSFGKIDEDAVYACTGNPSPSEIQKILDLMVNQPFEKAYNEVLQLKNVKAFALSDIIREVHQHIFRLGISDDCKVFLLEKLADIEYNLALGASEKLQTSAMIGAFQITKEAIVRKNITIADLIKPSVIE